MMHSSFENTTIKDHLKIIFGKILKNYTTLALLSVIRVGGLNLGK